MTQNEHSLSLMEMTADEETVETLYSKGLIGHQGHDLALEFLFPHQRWGYWTANILLTLGISLILVGIIFFFAFNWQKMSTFHKFSTRKRRSAPSVTACLAKVQREVKRREIS